MKKRILAVLCAAALLLSLTACQNQSTSESMSDSSSQSQASQSSESASAEESSSEEQSSVQSEESSEQSSDGGEYVKYVLDGEITPNMISKSRLNEGNKVRLANVIKKLQNSEEVTVGYIGGAITQGTSAGNDLCYAKLTTNWLEEKFPNAKINYVNAGIGATGSYIGVHRVGTDLLSQNPDLVFVEFSVNDTTEATERNKESYDSLLRTIWQYETNPAIITIVTTQEDGTSFQQYHSEIAIKYDLPMISYHDAILDVIDHGDIEWKDISDDNIHPNVPGHKIVSQLIQSYISDVIDNLDSISGEESDFSEPATKAGFVNGQLLTPSNTEAGGTGFDVQNTLFGGFNGYWMARAKSGESYGDTALTFEVTAKNIGILYGKMTSKATFADIYIDDEFVTTLNADFSGGWGNYVECAQLKTFDEEGKHTVKIVPKDADAASMFIVNALAIA